MDQDVVFLVKEVGQLPPAELFRHVKRSKWASFYDYLKDAQPMVWHKLEMESGKVTRLAQTAAKNWAGRKINQRNGRWRVSSVRHPTSDDAEPGYIWFVKHRPHEEPPLPPGG